MPDLTSGRLTPEELDSAVAWLNQQWKNAPCPMHRDAPTNWDIGGLIMTLPFTGGGVTLGGPTFPLLVVTCQQCGHTEFINAIRAGIVRVNSDG